VLGQCIALPNWGSVDKNVTGVSELGVIFNETIFVTYCPYTCLILPLRYEQFEKQVAPVVYFASISSLSVSCNETWNAYKELAGALLFVR